jgi:hypothetical protein
MYNRMRSWWYRYQLHRSANRLKMAGRFFCMYCGHMFAANLQEMRVYNGPTGQGPMVCPSCRSK